MAFAINAQVGDRTLSLDCENFDLWAVDGDGFIHQYKENQWSMDSIVGYSPIESIAIGYNQFGINTFLTHQGSIHYVYNNGIWDTYNLGGFSGNNIGAYKYKRYTIEHLGSIIQGIDSSNQYYQLLDLLGETLTGRDVALDSLGNAWVVTGINGHNPSEVLYVISPTGNVLKHYFFNGNMENYWFAGMAIVGDVLYASSNDNDLHRIELDESTMMASVVDVGHLNVGSSTVADLASCSPGNPGSIYPTNVTSSNNIDKSEFSIYPNPANSMLNVLSDNDLLIQLYSIEGRLCHQYFTDSKMTTINTHNIESGYYLLTISDQQKIISKKTISIIH